MSTAAAGDSLSHGRQRTRGERGGSPSAAAGGTNLLPPTGSSAQSAQAAQAGRQEPRGISYRLSLILSLSLLVVATGLSVSILSFRGARASAEQLAHDLFQEVSNHAVTKTRAFLYRAVPIAQTLADFAELGLATDDRDRLANQLAVVLRANPGVSWVSYSDENGAFVGAYRTPTGSLRVNQSYIDDQGQTPLVEHDVLEDGSWRTFRTAADSGFDPRKRPFYVRAKEARRLVWTPPYIFYEQGVPGVTCANPLYDKQGKLLGVFTVDFDLDTLSQFARHLSVSHHSRMFIMTADGTLLAHPGRSMSSIRTGQRDQGELLTAQTLGDPLIAAFDAQLQSSDRAPLAADMHHARQFTFSHEGTDYYARSTAFAIDSDLLWIVGVMAPQSDFLDAARHTSAVSAAASLGAMLLAVFVAMMLARRVSGPILSLVSFMDGVRRGDLSGRVRLGGAREFRQLSDALDRMLHDLRDGSRLRDAMAVAMQVQQSLLPAAPPKVQGLDVFGFSSYCDETGGDYFDYLPFREGLLVAVADVVGHGIGSALVMAGARGVLHSRATSCGHLGELMTHLNEQLVPETGRSRYVTMLLWYIEPRRGQACWASAGHDPAMVYDPQTGEFTESGHGGMPLGIELGQEYEEYSMPMRPGQVIVLGTDGIWEAMNEAREVYGKQRLMEVVKHNAQLGAEKIADAVRHDLDTFRGSQHQRDDVTLVVIKVLHRGDALESSD